MVTRGPTTFQQKKIFSRTGGSSPSPIFHAQVIFPQMLLNILIPTCMYKKLETMNQVIMTALVVILPTC